VADYVYGIVRAGAGVPGGTGIDGAPLRAIDGGRASALVSTGHGEELHLGREAMLTHARVLNDALAQGPVLPMRLGIVMSDEQEVRQRLLGEHAEQLGDQLDRFAGKFEASVRVSYEEEAVMREVLAANPEIRRLTAALKGRSEQATYPERIRLGELVAQAMEQLRERDEHDLLAALSQVALEVRVSDPSHERVALQASFLLARDHAEEFDDVLEALAEGQADRMRFRYTGPLPPHSFVELAGAA
jgi:hypothetical protein